MIMNVEPKVPISRWSRPGRDAVWIPAAILLGTGLLTGCLSRPSLVKRTFAFPPLPVTSTTEIARSRVLGIRRLTLAAPFDDQSLVYRTGEFTYERDPYAEFLIPPAETFAVAIRGYVRSSCVFRDVTEPGSASRPDTEVEICIEQLYGDFRNPSDASAVLEMRFIFFDAPTGISGKVLLQKICSRHVHVRTRTATSLMEGWNQALMQILDEVCSDLRTNAVASRGTPIHEQK